MCVGRLRSAVLFQFCLGNSLFPEREREKKKEEIVVLRLGLVRLATTCYRRWAWEFLSSPFSTPRSLLYISFLLLSLRFSHLNKLISAYELMALDLFFFSLSPSTPSLPTFSPRLSSPRGTVGVCGGEHWWCWKGGEDISGGLQMSVTPPPVKNFVVWQLRVDTAWTWH